MDVEIYIYCTTNISTMMMIIIDDSGWYTHLEVVCATEAHVHCGLPASSSREANNWRRRPSRCGAQRITTPLCGAKLLFPVKIGPLDVCCSNLIFDP